MTKVWTRDDVLALGIKTDVPTAGAILGDLCKDEAYRMVKRGNFPVPVIKVGRKLFVPTGPILAALSGKHASLGELVQAAWRAANGTGPAIQNAAGLAERQLSTGGALVPEDLRSELMLQTLESAIIRPRATVIPMRAPYERVPVIEEGSDSSGSIFGGLVFSWTEETAAITPSTANFGADMLEARKLAALLVAPDELLADSFRLDTFLREAVPAGLAFAEDAAFISGSGAGEPQGFLSAGCQIQVTRTGSPVNLADVASMATRMLPRSMNKYVWLASPDIFKTLLQIYLAVGSPVTQAVAPSEWLYYCDDQQCWCLLGRPIYSTEHVSAAGTTGDLMAVDPAFLVIGDWRQLEIEIASEGGGFIRAESSIRIRSRLDARVWLSGPVTPANGSETVSPVIILN
jgi:HK97 family phage major capsid protein